MSGQVKTAPGCWRSPGWLAGVLITLAGCASYDDFSWRKMNFEVFRDPPQPLEVIRTSKVGSERARALACLKEPAAIGGSQQEQDTVVAVLTYSAAHETQPWCRVAAIDALRKFKDVRATEGLKEAYYRAGSFNAQTASMLRCQALAALGETKNPAGMDLLVKVLREPPVEGPDQDLDLKLNERCAAAQALGSFKHYQATAALVETLRAADEIPLRNNAHEALVAITGKDIPPDAQRWAEYLHNPEGVKAPDRTVGTRLLELTGLRGEP